MVNHRAVWYYIQTERALKKLKSFLNHLLVGIQIHVLQNLHATKHILRKSTILVNSALHTTLEKT